MALLQYIYSKGINPFQLKRKGSWRWAALFISLMRVVRKGLCFRRIIYCVFAMLIRYVTLLTSLVKSTWASSPNTWSSSLLYNTACLLRFSIKPSTVQPWWLSNLLEILRCCLLSHTEGKSEDWRSLGNAGFLAANMALCFRGLTWAEFVIEWMINGFLLQDFSELLL